MSQTADFVTIDVVPRLGLHGPAWRRHARRAFAGRMPGLRAATVNISNNGTHSLVPTGWPGDSCIVAAWDSKEAAHEAFAGPLRSLLDHEDRFSLDGEIARVRLHEDHHHWHGWHPSSAGTAPLEATEPMVVLVHGVLHPRHLVRFGLNNLHAASRAAHHPGHRGSVDISSQLPFEHTSVSLWSSLAAARDYAYQPGGHLMAMRHALDHDTHRIGCFLQVRPLACSGRLGIESAAFPELPEVHRG